MKTSWCLLKLFLLFFSLWACPCAANAYYDPTIQRWVNRDPIAEAGGINLHCFARSNPINRIDPLGNQPPGVEIGIDLGIRISALCACRSAISDAMHGAESWADSNFGIPGQLHGTEGSVSDMLTHCVGACEVAKAEAVCFVAGINARNYLQNRENGGVRGGDRMDLENNNIGFGIADAGGDCKQGCLNAMANGQLWTVNANGQAGHNTPSR